MSTGESGRSWDWRFSPSLLEKDREVILEIGSDIFTRTELATELRSTRVRAASILSRGLRKFKPQNVEELVTRFTVRDFFAMPGVGPVTFRVWLDVLSYKNIDVEKWLNNQLSVSTMYREAKPVRKKTHSRR